MSFYASNNRIRITNKQNKVIFDTDKPMPHIIQDMAADIDVTFPALTTVQWRRIDQNQNSFACGRQEYVPKQVYVCRPIEICGYELVNGSMQWVCRTRDQCGWETQYSWETVYKTQLVGNGGYNYTAGSWEQTFDIGTITGNIQADFLLCNVNTVRANNPAVVDMPNIPCGLPIGKSAIANNTTILETASNVRDGELWLTRIMTVFVDNGKVKVTFKQTNRTYEAASVYRAEWCEWYGEPTYILPVPDSKSTYRFTFNIQVGKFTV